MLRSMINLCKRPEAVRISTESHLRIVRYRSTSTPAELNFRPIFKQRDERVTPMGWFMLVVPAATFGLGCWQVKRKIWKEQLIKELNEQLKKPAVPVPDDLDKLKDMEYQHVELRGYFLHDKEMLLGPRSLIRPDGAERKSGLMSTRDGGSGYLVVTPFKLADRDVIVLINRGWVSRNHLRPETRLEGQYKDEITLNAIVRKGEQRPAFTPSHKQSSIFLYRDLDKMCSFTGSSPYFFDAVYEANASPVAPIGGQTRVSMPNDHLSYLITWFSLSAATSYLWYRKIFKRKSF